MENKVDDFEVIQRVINTTQVIVPIYEASFKYKDHYYSIRNFMFVDKSEYENVKWIIQCGFILYEFSDRINGEIWNVYYLSLEEYIKYAELEEGLIHSLMGIPRQEPVLNQNSLLQTALQYLRFLH